MNLLEADKPSLKFSLSSTENGGNDTLRVPYSRRFVYRMTECIPFAFVSRSICNERGTDARLESIDCCPSEFQHSVCVVAVS